MQPQLLGVFETVYGSGAEMTLSRALIISVIGFLIVFVILGMLAVFVKLMGRGFDRVNAAKADKRALAPGDLPPYTISDNAPAGIPLPENTSAGELTLKNVSEQDAAVIMALVSHNSGIPLNRLRFNSIKLAEDEKE